MSTPESTVDWPIPEKLFKIPMARREQPFMGQPVKRHPGRDCYSGRGVLLPLVQLPPGDCDQLDVVALDVRVATAEKKSVTTLKANNAVLERETAMLREDSTKFLEETETWAERYEKLADS
jgi:hypothetical protein